MNKNSGVKVMCQNLMREMLWRNQPGETMEKFTYKKHAKES